MNDILSARMQGLSEAALRKEYTRLRNIAKRRQRNLEKAGFDRTYAYKFAKGRISFAPQKSLTLRDLKYELYDLTEYIENQRSTVRQAKAAALRQIAALQAAGYTYIDTIDKLFDFTDFMEYSRALKSGRTVGSDVVAEKFREYEKQEKAPDEIRGEFSKWLEREEKEKEKARALSDIRKASLGEL